MEKNKGGRKKLYANALEMQKKIDLYFESCFEEFIDETQIKRKVQTKPFTMSGLANALDMSRQSLLNYKNTEEFFDTVIKARRKVEQYTEERLFDKNGVNGAKFSLINNFDGWKEKQEIDTTLSNKDGAAFRIEEVTNMPDEKLEAEIRKLQGEGDA